MIAQHMLRFITIVINGIIIMCIAIIITITTIINTIAKHTHSKQHYWRSLSAAKISKLSLLVKHHILAIDEAS